MKTAFIVIGIVIVFLVIIIGIPLGMYISAYNKANSRENAIVAQYEQNQNKLSKLSNSVMESAQIPEMYKNDMKEVIQAGIEGRYGEGGSKQLVLAVQEAYPGTLDSSMYTKIMNMIESGRADFADEQSTLIDKVRVYKDELGSFVTGSWMSFAGYPKIDLDKYKIVNSNYTIKTFETGVDEGIKLGN